MSSVMPDPRSINLFIAKMQGSMEENPNLLFNWTRQKHISARIFRELFNYLLESEVRRAIRQKEREWEEEKKLLVEEKKELVTELADYQEKEMFENAESA